MSALKPAYVAQDNSVIATNIQYFSYLLNEGNCQTWLIKKVNTTTGVETTWAKGESSYSANWTGRAALVYSKNIVFDGRFF
jgi:hypothetical protein